MEITDLMRVTPAAPTTPVDSWREQAACLDLNWMTDRGRTREAREVCKSCPVITDCLAWVLDPDTPPVLGVVAGTTPKGRGHVECVECGIPMRHREARRGLCYRCIYAEKVAS